MVIIIIYFFYIFKHVKCQLNYYDDGDVQAILFAIVCFKLHIRGNVKIQTFF